MEMLPPKNPEAVRPGNEYLVCVRRSGQWRVVESAGNDHAAFKARNILAEHEMKYGHATNDDWKVFKRQDVQIMEYVEV